jgi:hypothetical protein
MARALVMSTAALPLFPQPPAPGDRAAVIAASGRMVVDFTGDREKLRDALSRMRPGRRGPKALA